MTTAKCLEDTDCNANLITEVNYLELETMNSINRLRRNMFTGKARPIHRKQNMYLPAVDEIPTDLDTFYRNMGGFVNEKTKEIVTELAPHQKQCWEDRAKSKYRLYLKSVKIGLSMVILLEDFHIALTRGRGKEILIIAQNKTAAKDHLRDLKKMILNSKYKDFLIDKPSANEGIRADEKTKADVIYLRNPGGRDQTKIKALGIASPGSLGSFKRVCHIHLSDVTFARMKEERFTKAFYGLYTCLASTKGTMIIECLPRKPSGPIFDIVNEDDKLKRQHINEKEDSKEILTPKGFLVRKYTVEVGIACGMITKKFVEQAKKLPGAKFNMYYMAKFDM